MSFVFHPDASIILIFSLFDALLLGIKNTTILFDDEIRRKRYTRVITEDKVLMVSIAPRILFLPCFL